MKNKKQSEMLDYLSPAICQIQSTKSITVTQKLKQESSTQQVFRRKKRKVSSFSKPETNKINGIH